MRYQTIISEEKSALSNWLSSNWTPSFTTMPMHNKLNLKNRRIYGSYAAISLRGIPNKVLEQLLYRTGLSLSCAFAAAWKMGHRNEPHSEEVYQALMEKSKVVSSQWMENYPPRKETKAS